MPMVRVVAGIDGDLELGADAVIGGDEDRIDEAGGLEVEQAAEAADLGIGAGAAGGADGGLDGLDKGIAGIDVDAGLLVESPFDGRFCASDMGACAGSGRGRKLTALIAARPRCTQGSPGHDTQKSGADLGRASPSSSSCCSGCSARSCCRSWSAWRWPTCSTRWSTQLQRVADRPRLGDGDRAAAA